MHDPFGLQLRCVSSPCIEANISRVLLSRCDTKPMLHLESYHRPCLRVIVSAVVVQ